MTLLAVDDGRVLGVEAQDVLRLVIDVVDLRDTAVRHRGRYARIAGREDQNSVRLRPADLRAGRGRTGRDGPLHVERDRRDDGPVGERTTAEQCRTQKGEYHVTRDSSHGFLRRLRWTHRFT